MIFFNSLLWHAKEKESALYMFLVLADILMQDIVQLQGSPSTL